MNTYNNNTERGVRPVGGQSYGESPASGPAPTTAGHHRHDILNKLDPRVDSTKDNRPIASNNHGDNGVPEGTYGPHRSRVANMLDPTVDSDLDSSRGGQRAANAASGGPTMHGAGGVGGNNYNNNNNVPEGTYGPHSSRIANALDPRVDSDADRNRAAPGGMAGMGGGGYAAQQPQQHSGMFSSTGPTTGANNNMASGPGPAPNTAGPHKSDLLNKLDPRVDSKTGAVSGTYGGGTGTQGTTGGGRYM